MPVRQKEKDDPFAFRNRLPVRKASGVNCPVAEARPQKFVVHDCVKTSQIMSEAVNKLDIIQSNRTHDADTGSCEVQIALLSARIAHLTDHLRTHRKDFHSRRGLIMMTNRRRKLLAYLKKLDLNRYNAIIQKLQLRR